MKDLQGIGYRVLSALRGPDNDNDQISSVLKQYVTSRIRGIVFDVFECRGIYSDGPLTATDLQDIREEIRGIKATACVGRHHFIQHLIAAVESTERHPIWDGRGEQLLHYLKQVRG